MESIRQWAFGVCAAAVACGLAQMVLPKSGMQRLFQITCSVFFLSCLLSPVALSLPSLELAAPDSLQQEIEERSRRIGEAAQEQAGELAGESLRLAAVKTLRELGVEADKIYINVHDDGEGGIFISECELTLDEQYFPRHDEIRFALHKALGVDIRIGYQKEGAHG